MSQSEYFLLTRVLLDFDQQSSEIISDISAAAFSDDGSLWVGSDEMVGVERLSPLGCHSYGKHQRFLLQDYIKLFNDEDEIDIEGMDFADGYLWLVGSHSTKRKQPKGKDLESDLERLATVTTDLNRFILARIPVSDGELVKSKVSSEGETLTAASLQTIDDRNLLWETFKEDPHLKPFITAAIPSKDNGLDIEGLAVKGDRLFLGLRGPVLRGWSVIIEIQVERSEPETLILKELTDEGATYKKHFLDLNGLGVRELCWHENDLIILAGPTMDLEGEMQVFLWQDPLNYSGHNIHPQEENRLVPLFDLPFTVGSDHAEGLALYSCWGEKNSLMIFYDSPNPNRLKGDRQILVDVFRL